MSTDVLAYLHELAERCPSPIGAQYLRTAADELREIEKTDYLGALYRTDFEVEGAGEFPHDMLRYANCWPSGEGDSFKLGENHHEKRSVLLTKYHRDPEPVLAEDRWWHKFRWRVVRKHETTRL